MKNSTTKEYPCSVLELYSICGTAIGNFVLFIDSFIGFRKAYDAPFVINIKKLLSDAIALPDGQQSNEDSVILHGKMETNGKVVLRNFRVLKRYIIHAFADPVEQNAKLASAGAALYKIARGSNWESMSGLNTAMISFISANKVALKADDNMSEDFIETVNTGAENFQKSYDDYKLAEQRSEITAAKVKANNKLYKAVMSMLQDGQVIFEDDAETAQRFVFTSIWDMITIQNTGIKLKVKSVPDNMPVYYAQVTIQKPGEPAEVLGVDEEGELVRKVASGPVTLVISAEGKVTKTISLNLDNGSYKTVDVDLQNAA